MGNDGKKLQLNIEGMTCKNCQNRIERALLKTNGIINAAVSYENNKAEILYDDEKISLAEITEAIKILGYDISNGRSKFLRNVFMLLAIISIYVLLQSTGVINLLVPGQLADTKMSYGMLFVIGLITSVHCVAMCGGINLSQCISDITSFYSAVVYNFGRVLSYTIIGGILGSLGFLANGGGRFELSIFLQSTLKITAGVFMVIMGANMLNLFPSLRKYSIRLPKFLSNKIFLARLNFNRPFIVGLLNGFMPCGPLQAMWLVALASGNIFAGALSMFMFALGTVPLMLGLGAIVQALGKKFTNSVMTSGAVLVTVMGLIMISQGGILSGWFNNTHETITEASENLQIVNSTLLPGKYPDIKIKAGVPVKWIIDAPKGSINGCNYKFLINEYGIEHTFKTGENVINFTPSKNGTIYYSCWMGMIRGKILVDV